MSLKQRLESIGYPFGLCWSTALLMVSLEKNLMEFHILLLMNTEDFSPLSLLIALFLCNQLLKTRISGVYLSSLIYEFPFNVSNFVETHLIE